MPLREYACNSCGHLMENLERSEADKITECGNCKSKDVVPLISSHGGYHMNSGPASVRPKRAGSFKRTKK